MTAGSKTGWSAIAMVFAVVIGFADRASAAAQPAFDEALRGGHDVFLVVTQAQASGTDAARDLATQAAALAPGTQVVELDRGDAANAALVTRFRLASVAVPMILVVSRNGVPAAGALASGTTPKQLAAMIPSPRKADYLKALNDGQAVFLVLGRPDMPALAPLVKACEEADAKLNQEAQAAVKVGEMMPKDQASVVQVDLADPAERGFLVECQASLQATQPIVLVVNPKGQTTATMEAAGVNVPALVAAAKKRVAECCPGGKCH